MVLKGASGHGPSDTLARISHRYQSMRGLRFMVGLAGLSFFSSANARDLPQIQNWRCESLLKGFAAQYFGLKNSELADPSLQILSDGRRRISGTAHSDEGSWALEFKNRIDFQRKENAEILSIPLSDSAGRPLSAPIWDPDRYEIYSGSQLVDEVLVGGVPSVHPTSLEAGRHEDRRPFLFIEGRQSKYPIAPGAAFGWLGHSYGLSLRQEGSINPHHLDLKSNSTIYAIYESVTHVENHFPQLTMPVIVPVQLKLGLGGKLELTATSTQARSLFHPQFNLNSIGARFRPGVNNEGPRPFTFFDQNGEAVYGAAPSGGDFDSHAYRPWLGLSMNGKLDGYYAPVLDRAGNIRDYGDELRRAGYSWGGRMAFFQERPENLILNGLGHAVKMSDYPNYNFSKLPNE